MKNEITKIVKGYDPEQRAYEAEQKKKMYELEAPFLKAYEEEYTQLRNKLMAEDEAPSAKFDEEEKEIMQ